MTKREAAKLHLHIDEMNDGRDADIIARPERGKHLGIGI
jgi:hypothetical protein